MSRETPKTVESQPSVAGSGTIETSAASPDPAAGSATTVADRDATRGERIGEAGAGPRDIDTFFIPFPTLILPGSPVKPPGVAPHPVLPDLPEIDRDRIRRSLIAYLGSPEAADAWLSSTETGYPTTADDAIAQGHARLVFEDLMGQWGPSPHYA